MIAPIGLGLALATSLAWARLDASRKALVRDVAPIPLVVVMTFGQAPLFLVWAARDGGWLGPGYAIPGLTVLGLNVLSNVAFVQAIRISPLSLTIPFLSFTPVFTTLVAVPLLGEVPSPVQLAGIGTVVLGAMVLHSGRGSGGGLLGPFRSFLREKGSVLMTAVALMWSMTAALDKVALDHASVPAHGLVQTGGVGVVLLVFLVARGRVSELGHARRRPVVMLVAIGFATAAIAFQLLAIRVMLVALVETIKRAIGMISSVVVGRVMFDEALTPQKIVAIVLMTAGTALLTLPL